MPHVVLFHSILGLRAAERDLAAALEADGHVVTLPDLYEGQTTEDYEDGFRLKEATGEASIMDRARAALGKAPEDAVLAGVSYGAYLVGQLWGERPRMPGALLIAGGAGWAPTLRRGLPVQAHVARPDPFDEESFFVAWEGANPGVALEFCRYDGVGHYFLDPNLPDFDRDSAQLCLARSRQFLAGL